MTPTFAPAENQEISDRSDLKKTFSERSMGFGRLLWVFEAFRWVFQTKTAENKLKKNRKIVFYRHAKVFAASTVDGIYRSLKKRRYR